MKACGVWQDVSWWGLLVRTRQTRRLLVCLEEQVVKAQAEHVTFKVTMSCVLVGLLISFGVLRHPCGVVLCHRQAGSRCLTVFLLTAEGEGALAGHRTRCSPRQ